MDELLSDAGWQRSLLSKKPDLVEVAYPGKVVFSENVARAL